MNDVFSSYSGDPSVSNYGYADSYNYYPPSVSVSDPSTLGFSAAADAAGPVYDNTTYGIDPNSVGAVGSIANSIKSIFGGLQGNQGPNYTPYDPITGLPTQQTVLAGVASSLTGVLTSFLPAILIGLVIYLFFGIARKHGR